jgi:hypothetical protein
MMIWVLFLLAMHCVGFCVDVCSLHEWIEAPYASLGNGRLTRRSRLVTQETIKDICKYLITTPRIFDTESQA